MSRAKNISDARKLLSRVDSSLTIRVILHREIYGPRRMDSISDLVGSPVKITTCLHVTMPNKVLFETTSSKELLGWVRGYAYARKTAS